jgi:uncharacterized protein (TIGR03382 family)
MRTILLGLFALSLAQATPTITIYASLGPTPDSPAYGDFLNNLASGMRNGGVANGTAAGQWSPLSNNTLPPNFILWDDSWAFAPFYVWRGEANPAAPFDAESGTWLYLSAFIAGNGSPLTLAGITVESLWGNFSRTYSEFDSYSLDVVGFLGGIPVNNGEPGDTPVDNIAIRGPAFYLDVSCSVLQNLPQAFCAPGLTPQERYELATLATATFIGTTIDATYTLPGSTPISATGTAHLTPEPTTITLCAAALAAALLRRRSRYTKQNVPWHHHPLPPTSGKPSRTPCAASSPRLPTCAPNS